MRAARGVGLNRLAKNNRSDPLVGVPYSNRFAAGGEDTTVQGLPLTSPPYAVLTAVDLNRGELAWRVPLGAGSDALRANPLLEGVALPDRLGSPNNRGGAMVTRSGIVFIGGTPTGVLSVTAFNSGASGAGAVCVALTNNDFTPTASPI